MFLIFSLPSPLPPIISKIELLFFNEIQSIVFEIEVFPSAAEDAAKPFLITFFLMKKQTEGYEGLNTIAAVSSSTLPKKKVQA